MESREQITYTTIIHQARVELDISSDHYCIADYIFKMQHDPRKHTGWCYASKDRIAEDLGIPRRTVFRHLEDLIGKRIVEKHPETFHLKTTTKWYDSVIVRKAKIRPAGNGNGGSAKMALPVPDGHPEPCRSGTPDSAKMSPDNNTYKKTDNTFPSPLPSPQKKQSGNVVNGIRKGKMGKEDTNDKNLFEKLRSGIYRKELFELYDNLLQRKNINELVEHAAYKAARSALYNNDTFVKEEFGVVFHRFPFDGLAETVKNKFPYDKLPAGEFRRRDFFVAAVANSTTSTLIEHIKSQSSKGEKHDV